MVTAMHRQGQNLDSGQPKQENVQPKKELVTINSHGVTVQVDRNKFNDLELFDLIDEIQSGNVFKMPKLMRCIFDEQHAMVLEGLRDENGIVTADKASEFLVEVLQQIGPNS